MILYCYRVKQTQEIQAKITEDLREMDKPMARAADDVDLDAHLKNIERAEDPMFAYMKKKRAKLSGAKSKHCSIIYSVSNYIALELHLTVQRSFKVLKESTT